MHKLLKKFTHVKIEDTIIELYIIIYMKNYIHVTTILYLWNKTHDWNHNNRFHGVFEKPFITATSLWHC